MLWHDSMEDKVLRISQEELEAMPNFTPSPTEKDIIPNTESWVAHPDAEFTTKRKFSRITKFFKAIVTELVSPHRKSVSFALHLWKTRDTVQRLHVRRRYVTREIKLFLENDVKGFTSFIIQLQKNQGMDENLEKNIIKKTARGVTNEQHCRRCFIMFNQSWSYASAGS